MIPLIFIFVILQIIYGVIIIDYYNNNCEDESLKHIYTLGLTLIFTSVLLLLINLLLSLNYYKSKMNVVGYLKDNMSYMLIAYILILIISIISAITSFYIFMDIKRENSDLYNYTVFITPYTIYNCVICSISIMLVIYLNLCYFTNSFTANVIKKSLNNNKTHLKNY
jgi:hypothetical protein